MVHVSERAHYCLKGKGKRETWREDPHPWLRIFGSRVLFTIPYFYLMLYLISLILELLQNSASNGLCSRVQDCCRVRSFCCNSSWQELGLGLSLANGWVISWLLLALRGVLRILQALVCRRDLMKEWIKRDQDYFSCGIEFSKFVRARFEKVRFSFCEGTYQCFRFWFPSLCHSQLQILTDKSRV